MRIISAYGEFDLPTGFTLNITAFNQMFNSEGEQSVPVTLPSSPGNLATLRFPNRVDSFYKPVSEISVDVIDDVFMRPARMVVHSANESEGISCTLYFSEASFINSNVRFVINLLFYSSRTRFSCKIWSFLGTIYYPR